MSTPEQSDSLVAVLNKAQIPIDNHEFIKRLANGVGIIDYQVVDTDKPHVIARRRDGGRDLHIYYGYTTRFPSEEEIVRVLGPGVVRKAAKSPKGSWWVAHPTNEIYDGSARSMDRRREAGFCTCGMQLALTGKCDDCD